MNKLKSLLKNRKIAIAAVFMLGAVIVSLSAIGDSVITAAIKRELPIYCVEKQSKMVSLTFDAAWGNEDTERLIEILSKYDIKATFFVVGEWAEKYPESVKALNDAGHEVMTHSDTHPHMTKLSAEEIRRELTSSCEKIAAVTGKTPVLFRAPYGEYNDTVIKTAREMGLYTIQWDVDSLDWKNPTPEQIKKRVLERVNPGSIILFHNAAENTPAALPEIIDGLIRKGYCFVPVSELILTKNYEIDHTGKQISLSRDIH